MRPPAYRMERHAALDGAPTRLALHGEVDMAATSALSADLGRLREDRTPVLLDLSGVTFLDSTGVCALISAALDGRRDGWALTMVPPSGYPLTVLQVCGVLDELPLVRPAVAG